MNSFKHLFINSCLSAENDVYQVQNNFTKNIFSFIIRKAYKPILKDLFPNYYGHLDFIFRIFEKNNIKGRGIHKRQPITEISTMYKYKRVKIYPKDNIPLNGPMLEKNPH